MFSRLIWQARAVLGLYSSVKTLILIYLAAVLVGMLFEAAALAAIVPLIGGAGGVAEFYDRVLQSLGLPQSDGALIGLIAGLFVGRSLAQYCSALLGGLVVRRETVRLQVELFALYLDLDWDEMVKTNRGQVNLLLNSHTHEVAMFMYRAITLLEGILYAIGLGFVALLISPGNTILAVGLIGASVAGVAGIAGRVRRYAAAILETSQQQANRLLEYAAHAPLLRAYGVSDRVIEDIRSRAEERESIAFRSQRIESLGWILPDLLFVLALLAVVGLAHRAGDEIAEVGAIVALLYRVSQYLKRFGDFSSMSAVLPTIRTVHRYRRVFREHSAPALGETVDASLPVGAVRFSDVAYRYDGSALDAVDGLSFQAEPGEYVGIVGPSGGGKSTVVQLLIGLLRPTAGAVKVGASIGSMTGAVAYVPQTPVVISGTVASNVAWFRDCSRDDIEAACRAAGLEEVLSRMPDGIDTVIAQDGASLSGGERQRLALARALVGHPAILVLDEATSSLDAVSEAAVQKAIGDLHGSVTIVAVAHRLSTVLHADCVLVLEKGRIVEHGKPSELMAKEGSAFARMTSLQGISPR